MYRIQHLDHLSNVIVTGVCDDVFIVMLMHDDRWILELVCTFIYRCARYGVSAAK